MSAQRNRIGLVGCGKAKIELEAGETVQAKNLYDSNYFQLKRDYAESCCSEWWILSAEHGLIAPDEEIETYDASLSQRHDSYVGRDRVNEWGATVGETLESMAQSQTFVVIAGQDYVRPIKSYLDAFEDVLYPFDADELNGMGDQMSWLKTQTENAKIVIY